MSILARNKPYPHGIKDTYICTRCGIQRKHHGATARKPTHCRDCKPYEQEPRQ